MSTTDTGALVVVLSLQLLNVKLMLTDVLLSVTGEEIESVCRSVYSKCKKRESAGSLLHTLPSGGTLGRVPLCCNVDSDTHYRTISQSKLAIELCEYLDSLTCILVEMLSRQLPMLYIIEDILDRTHPNYSVYHTIERCITIQLLSSSILSMVQNSDSKFS